MKQYFTQKGLAPDRVQTEGKGESEPVTQCGKMGPERASNRKLVSCLQPDRRVEIEVLGHREVAASGTEPSGAGSGAGTGSGSGSGSGSASGTR